MALFKCKMCGGNLEVQEGMTVCECEYCGSVQTVPQLDDEKKIALFTRANRLRNACEFDKAAGVYETIIADFPEEAEAYWGLLLCKFGIEYVDDPKTGKKIPTCHRSSFDSIMDDSDFEMVMEYSDPESRAVYRNEAKAIEELRIGINEVSSKEEPYDIFICYKETDAMGERTIDSVIAQDVYDALVEKGYKVFFSRITLEDKLGQEYEPYIFAALNSAKVMLAFGTDYEYYNAVWVKNEWSRFLGLIEKGAKKTLIPCFKGIDAYDMPKEFARLQAQDMGKVGAIQDLIRGIKKIIGNELPTATVTKETVADSGRTNTEPLLKRAFMFLEDCDWKSANEYYEKVLDIDPENTSAYLGKLMAELRVRRQEDLKDVRETFDNNNNYKKVLRFGDENLKEILVGYIEHINTRNENKRLNGIYTDAKDIMSEAHTEGAYKEAAQLFESVSEYLDSAALAKECYEKANKVNSDIKKCDELFKLLKSTIRNETDGKGRKEQVEQNISELTSHHRQLLELRSKWSEIEKNIVSLNREIQTIQEEISQLNNEVSSLGFFAGTRKKEIKGEIASHERKIQSLKGQVTTYEVQKAEFSSWEILLNEISKTEEKINEQNKVLVDICNVIDSSKIREELNCYEYGKKLLSEFSESLFSAKEGDYIKFGTYPQTKTGDKLDIEWLVLEVKDGKALVISKYALDCKEYNTRIIDVTWETCTLRKWLNNNFINAAFSADEKAMIPTVTVTAEKNPKHRTEPGNATQDQVFLLSIAEVNKYLSSVDTRQCKPTDYAVRGETDVKRSNGNCWWWLRSPGILQNNAAYVSNVGAVQESGHYVGTIMESGSRYGNNDTAVRPAMWIDLNY